MEWIEAEERAPDDIGQIVSVYPFEGRVVLAQYVGEGFYYVKNRTTIHGTEITHWHPAIIPEPPKGE